MIMTARTYYQLPINADEGFPQSFHLNFDNQSYQILLYVNILEQETPYPEDHVFELPDAKAFLVMQVARVSATGTQVILQRKLVPNHEYTAREVAFIFQTMRVAMKNINGVGSFGSQVIGGIAARWAS
jgi:hypothetical protein